MSAPTCPSCKAKFSFSNISETCNKCGLPREFLVLEGEDRARAIKAWKKGQLPFVPQPTMDLNERRKGAKDSRRPKRHGVVKGRGRVAKKQPRPKYPKKVKTNA